jgi:ABC-type Na+ transport system ATPase subunit NatA
MLFEFQNVTKTYGSVTALDDLSVAVPEGAIGLLGPNGSGKTTMIRGLLGLIPVDRGSGQILGMDFQKRQLDIRRAVGFAPEDECLFPGVVGVEFVGYAGELVGMRPKDALQRAHHLSFEVRVKDGVAAMARGLLAAGCVTEVRDDLLLVRVPDGQSGDLVWKVAAAERRQIRYLRPQRSTLEEVFLQAVEPT